MIIIKYFLSLVVSEPWNKFLCLLQLSVSMKACFAFNVSIQCFLIRPGNHLKDLPQVKIV